MKRYNTKPRAEWKKEVEKLGFDYHTDPDGYPYWNESSFYELTEEAVALVETGVNEIHRLCLELVDKAITNDEMLAKLQIPKRFWPLVRESWKKREPTLYGRFDLMFDGTGPPKLLEYNADTPTTILEAAVVQWEWKKHFFPQFSQFNTIHEKLIETWKTLKVEGETHFASVSFSLEDYRTAMYILDTAHQSGINGRYIKIEDVGWDTQGKMFVNENKVPIVNMFRLYPYEWMVREKFAGCLLQQKNPTRLIEPAWKMLLSNKAILPLLWEMFPGHPNLLPAFFTPHPDLQDSYVKKPIFGREGENITFQYKDESFFTRGYYGSEGYVYQQYSPVVDYGGRRPIVGGWVVGGRAAGIGIREDISAITGNTSFFVPHIVRKADDATPWPYQNVPLKRYEMHDLMMEQSHIELPFCAVKLPKTCSIS